MNFECKLINLGIAHNNLLFDTVFGKQLRPCYYRDKKGDIAALEKLKLDRRSL